MFSVCWQTLLHYFYLKRDFKDHTIFISYMLFICFLAHLCGYNAIRAALDVLLCSQRRFGKIRFTIFRWCAFRLEVLVTLEIGELRILLQCYESTALRLLQTNSLVLTYFLLFCIVDQVVDTGKNLDFCSDRANTSPRYLLTISK